MEIVLPPKKLIANTFSRSASRYCSAAFIQRRILEQCVKRMKNSGLSCGSWLDAGCGANMLGELLAPGPGAWRMFRTDIALGSLKLIHAQRSGVSFSVQSDLEYLPFKPGTFDGVVVSSVLHWLKDVRPGLLELKRILKPAGRIVFAAFLNGSFLEVCSLRERIGLAIPVRFIAGEQLRAAMSGCGLDLMEMSTKNEKHYFQSAWEVLKYLSDIGCSAVSGKRLSRSGLIEFCSEYENRFGTPQGIPLSCRFACGIAQRQEN
jgi:malonyl-CoA O-methyltransferase